MVENLQEVDDAEARPALTLPLFSTIADLGRQRRLSAELTSRHQNQDGRES